MKKSTIKLEFPPNADLFPSFESYGHYSFRTITTYQSLIHNAETEDEKAELMGDLIRHLWASTESAVWSKIGVEQ